MKKRSEFIDPSIEGLEVNQNLGIDKKKTTNVNILLNRVKMDQKRTRKKQIIFSLFLVCAISALAIYFSI